MPRRTVPAPTRFITALSAAALTGLLLLPVEAGTAAPPQSSGTNTAPASAAPKPQYIKYPWSSTVYARTSTDSGDRWKALSWSDYAAAGYPKASSGGFIPGTSVYRQPGDQTIWGSLDGAKQRLSFTEWTSMGLPSPGSKAAAEGKSPSPAEAAKSDDPGPTPRATTSAAVPADEDSPGATAQTAQNRPRNVPSSAAPDQTAARASTGPTSLEVASFNVDSAWRQKTDPSIPGWGQRVQGIARIINAAKPDVIGIQEAPDITIDGRTYRQADDIRRQTSYEMYQAPDGATMPLPILYRGGLYDRLDAGYKVFENQPYPNYGRAMTWVKLRSKASGGVFFVFNTHFMVGNDKQPVREEEARLLAGEIARVNPARLPGFVTGDFNASATKTAPQARELSALGFQDAYVAAIDRVHSDLKTYNGYAPPQAGSSRIDQVYAGARGEDALQVSFWENWVATGDQLIGGQQPSDHDMIYARATFK